MEPARRSLKRKHYQVLKNDQSVELTKLTNDSRRLHTDFGNADEDFELMCKSMNDSQAEFLTRSLFLEEKYDEVVGMLDGKVTAKEGESSGENMVLPTAYAATFHRFVTDSNNSLKDHCILMKEEHLKMEKMFEKYGEMWKQNMKELQERAVVFEGQRTKLSGKLIEFNRCEVEDSDSD